MAGEGRGCDDVGTSTVEFGYDGLGCCVLSLTRDALAQVIHVPLTPSDEYRYSTLKLVRTPFSRPRSRLRYGGGVLICCLPWSFDH